MRPRLDPVQQASHRDVILCPEATATTRQSDEALVVARHVIHELGSGCEAMLKQRDNRRFSHARSIVYRDQIFNDMQVERHERTNAQLEAQRSSDRCTERRVRYAQTAGQRSCLASALASWGLFGTDKISKRKRQA